MKVRLLESANDTWAPAGTVGELEDKGEGLIQAFRFLPEGYTLWLWIGRVKWEEVGDHVVNTNKMIEPAKPRKRGK